MTRSTLVYAPPPDSAGRDSGLSIGMDESSASSVDARRDQLRARVNLNHRLTSDKPVVQGVVNQLPQVKSPKNLIPSARRSPRRHKH